jgi:hypothetical protein
MCVTAMKVCALSSHMHHVASLTVKVFVANVHMHHKERLKGSPQVQDM